MPISGSKAGASKPTGNGTTTGRPPWLKDTGKTVSTTEAPWKRNLKPIATPSNNNTNGVQKEVKLQSREIKVPVVTQRKTSIPSEPLVKPKPKEIKVIVPEDDYKTSSSEYEEVTDSEEEVEEEESEETESDSESDSKADEEKQNVLPIQVKLKPVERPNEVKKSPSVDRAGKFIKPALKKVPTLDKLDKPKPPPVTIPERKPLRHVEKPILEEPREEPKEIVRPPLRRVDSTAKKRKLNSRLSSCYVVKNKKVLL